MCKQCGLCTNIFQSASRMAKFDRCRQKCGFCCEVTDFVRSTSDNTVHIACVEGVRQTNGVVVWRGSCSCGGFMSRTFKTRSKALDAAEVHSGSVKLPLSRASATVDRSRYLKPDFSNVDVAGVLTYARSSLKDIEDAKKCPDCGQNRSNEGTGGIDPAGNWVCSPCIHERAARAADASPGLGLL